MGNHLNNPDVETTLKIKELERLLSEGKITLERYLDARVEIEHPIDSRRLDRISAKKRTTDTRVYETQPPRERRPYKTMFLGIVLSSIILAGGFVAWNYLNPVRAESLSVEDYSYKILTNGEILWKLKNTGNTDIRISEVRLNGYLNRSIDGWSQGWNGTVFMQPGESGTIHVYMPCYFYILNESMPYPSSTLSQAEIQNLYSWMESFNCTFTFVTNTQQEYDCRVPGLTWIMYPAWMGSLTFTFMETEEIKITDLDFGTTGQIDVACRNTGTSPVTLVEAWVNGGKNSDISVTISANNQETINLIYSWQAGNTYEVKMITSKGNAFLRTETAPA